MKKTVSKDSLGDRMKAYENRESFRHLDRVPFVARMDGRGFSKLTKGLPKPDPRFARLMIETSRFLIETTGALVAYTQSDEITLVFYTEEHDQQLWYDSKHDKIVSHLGSLTSDFFNFLMPQLVPEKVPVLHPHASFCSLVNPAEYGSCTCGALSKSKKTTLAEFDARCFTVPNLKEASNAVLWRQADAIRNSVSMLAQGQFSHKQLEKKARRDQLALLKDKGIDWNEQPASFKWGTLLRRIETRRPFNEEEMARIPEDKRDDLKEQLIIRREVVELDVLPLKNFSADDRVAILFQEPTTMPQPEIIPE
jgi:tRNA(His) guanylyltransferase